jgi:ABC-2 type transport system ATP-binding protein
MDASSSDAITLRGVRKAFGATVAVDALDLRVPRGGFVGLIGPNGAGKTTAIRMVMSILFPDAGEIRVLGHASALEAKDRIGYLPEERGVYRKMRVGAFLRYVARLKGVREAGLRERVRAWLERVGLADVEHRRCDELSKGMQQKEQFVATLLHEPDLLILDEPFSGLDPVSMRLLRELVGERHRAGATVVFSTHVMAQAEEICDRVVMLDRGRKVLDDRWIDIRRRHEARAVSIEPLDAALEPAVLEAVPGVARVVARGDGFDAMVAPGSRPEDVMRELVCAVPASRVELRRPSLEEVFVELVSRVGAPSAEEP